MEHEGPVLETLTHRLSECPGDFLREPRPGGEGCIDVAALVCDYLRTLGVKLEGYVDLNLLRPAGNDAAANRLRVIAVAVWLLSDEWFLKHRQYAPAAAALLLHGLDKAAAVVVAEQFVADPDRREELVRICLNRYGLRPQGETIQQAADRLTALDSDERARVVRKTRDAEARARVVREKMARRAAEEAAAKASRE